MSYVSNKRSESSPSRRSLDDEDTTEDGADDRGDESKRRSRNLSEKKRRDQFNVLINELCSMVATSARKMDKSTVLKATIAFLKVHSELAVQSQVQETQEDWKPSFLSNEEFTHLMLEALDGFIIVISSCGKIIYLSESITSLLGYLSSELVSGPSTIYDYILQEERSDLCEMLTNPSEDKYKTPVSIKLNFRVGDLERSKENQKYQLVKLVGYFKRWISPTECGTKSLVAHSTNPNSDSRTAPGYSCVLVATGRLHVCDLLREMSVVVDLDKNEFSSRHSLEWKFLFLDHRGPPIIGYLPFEVLGTSGYDYYHVDDLEKVASCHETLMQRGEGTSCHYRFLTKGQQWIWLQTRFYITYHQWNSKPEFIVCTHRVVSYADVMKEFRGEVSPSTFEEVPSSQRSGPSVPKQSKLDSKGSATPCLRISKHKNGSVNYGEADAKKNLVDKMELPPKFTSAAGSCHSMSDQLQEQSRVIPLDENLMPLSDNVDGVGCAKPQSTLHPQLQELKQSPHHVSAASSLVPSPPCEPSAIAIPLAAYNSKPQNPPFVIARPQQTAEAALVVPVLHGTSVTASSPCVLQEELLKKHAELQRQIIEQQEELRRVSEQLLMSQCGWSQGEEVMFSQNYNQPFQPQSEADGNQAQQQPLMVYDASSGALRKSFPEQTLESYTEKN